ncbi:hypothetical protein CDD81_1240 [Ophiocordyceps australis]|uniref:Uncharacterized protein n=1 Tax=Ophiocordyceps australis TaxID=1399860 RepID=A0A2C5YG74_9HYPO|nr:hypothetical protein CDD81_1240 [Ophiocordyceps australis]
MDAPEAELDVKLHKMSGELLAELDGAMQAVAREAEASRRGEVRARETLEVATRTLDMFQELPQLLDAHLARWIWLLGNAHLRQCLAPRAQHGQATDGPLVPVDYAICRILYSFCKVRGEKVVVRFLPAQARHLEPLLAAMEAAEGTPGAWTWEQRYVVMLWLAHLLLAPFDLATMSSAADDDGGAEGAAPLPGLECQGLPGIAARVLPLGVKYLAAPGKEKDAAVALLVRTAMRRDMQQLGVLRGLVNWALAALRPAAGQEARHTTYFYIGTLLLLSRLLRAAAETSDMDPFLSPIFHCVYAMATHSDGPWAMLTPLALVRKLLLKIMRSVAVAKSSHHDVPATELVETAISHFLESLSDRDTPVRLAASKALGLITLKLQPDMALQVVEAVLQSLERNVLWHSHASGSRVRDLSAVNALEWHGLTMTLSHLLYRRSPPPSQLSAIIQRLLVALSFEQRSTSGGSLGANVRDAACFGIWAIARRYSSSELALVSGQSSTTSILQLLATQLVTSACLDPAGNIRRGASAALQELIGRHPDTVEKGISVVQTVDYHAVARRSRAMQQVSAAAAKLSSKYAEALLDAILNWRGIGDAHAPSRRAAGAAFGVLTAEMAQLDPHQALSHMQASVHTLMDRLTSLLQRQVEERHGLLVCFASVLSHLPRVMRAAQGQEQTATSQRCDLMHDILSCVVKVVKDCRVTTHRKPDIVAEGASKLVVAALPIIHATALPSTSNHELLTGHELMPPHKSSGYLHLITALDSYETANAHLEPLISELRAAMPAWLSRNEMETVEPVAAAALVLLILSRPDDRAKTLQEWMDVVRTKPANRAVTTGLGFFQAVALAQPLADACALSSNSTETDGICEAFLERWREDAHVETRTALLGSLIRSRLICTKPLPFLKLLQAGLDDYTTTARGDVGSHVRVQALRAVRLLWEQSSDGSAQETEWIDESIKTLFGSTLRLAAEKLDRVRVEAQMVVALTLQQVHAKRLRCLSCSSQAYFEALLGLVSHDMVQPCIWQAVEPEADGLVRQLLSGFVTSADTGNDELVIASRAALAGFCSTRQQQLKTVWKGLVHNLAGQQGEDRIVVPTLETAAFLLVCGLHSQQACAKLCAQTQRAAYKSGNVRKLLACVRVYGGVASMAGSAATADGGTTSRQAAREARKRLGALLFHPWPRVRNAVVDELWGLLSCSSKEPESQQQEHEGQDRVDEHGQGQQLLGIDWAKADKAAIRAAVQELGLE